MGFEVSSSTSFENNLEEKSTGKLVEIFGKPGKVTFSTKSANFICPLAIYYAWMGLLIGFLYYTDDRSKTVYFEK